MSFIIGLTGEIGSGKSEFTRMLHEAEPDSASFESREVITEVANVFNEYLRKHDISTLRFEDVNFVLIETAIWMNEHFKTNIDTGLITFTVKEFQAKPEQFARWQDYLELIQTDADLLRTHIDTTNKLKFRPLLQWLGGYFPYKYRPGIWFEEISRRILELDPQPKLVSINALRYPHDEAAIREFAVQHGHTCFVVAIERPGTRDSNDITENSRDLIKADIEVVNNGTLGELEHIAKKLLNDFPNPRDVYNAQ